jgi:hypothetical protein
MGYVSQIIREDICRTPRTEESLQLGPPKRFGGNGDRRLIYSGFGDPE